MPEYFDLNSDSAPKSGPDFEGIQSVAVERDLLDSLDRMHELFDAMDERDAHEPLPPRVEGLLEAITNSPDAPVTYQSVGRRVQDGTITWKQFWDAPEKESDGLRLVARVMTELNREATIAIAAHTDRLPPEVGATWIEDHQAEIDDAESTERLPGWVDPQSEPDPTTTPPSQ